MKGVEWKISLMQHKTIKLPLSMLNAIEDYIQENPDYGYTSSADFIKEKLRVALKELEEKHKKK